MTAAEIGVVVRRLDEWIRDQADARRYAADAQAVADWAALRKALGELTADRIAPPKETP